MMSSVSVGRLGLCELCGEAALALHSTSDYETHSSVPFPSPSPPALHGKSKSAVTYGSS